MSNPTLLRVEYVDYLEGDHLAALMLAQIFYWYMPGDTGQPKIQKYASREKGGPKKWWLAKTNVHWYEELRLTRSQVNRCLKVLKDKDLIETWVTLYDGHPTVHINCTLIPGNVLTNARLEAIHCMMTSNPLHANVQSITETTTETTTETGFANAKQGQENFTNFTMQVGERKNQELLNMNANETMAKLKSKKSLPAKEPTNPTEVSLRWKERAGEATGYCKEFTGKDKGNFKQLFKALGAQSNKVVDYVWDNWSKFCSKVQAVKGLEVAPTQPNLGFFVAYHDVAVQLIASKNTVVAPQKIAVILDKPIEQGTLAAQDKPTQEMMDAALQKLL